MSLKTWLRDLIGLDTIEKNVLDSQKRILDQYTSITSEIEKLKDQSTENKIRYLQPSKEEAGEIKNSENPQLPLARSFSIDNKKKDTAVTFTLKENDLVASDWLELNTTAGQKSNWSNILSSAAGLGGLTGATIQSSSGLYTTTATASQLSALKDGVGTAVRVEGKIVEHIPFHSAGPSAFTPLIVFQMASMVTGQYYFNNLSDQLNKVLDKLSSLERLHHIERESKLKYAFSSLKKYADRRYFVLEDFVHLDHISYDLKTIREEYVISSIEKMQEINKLVSAVSSNKENDEIILAEEANFLEKGKHLFNKGMSGIKNSKAVNVLHSGLDGAGNLLRSSQTKVETINQKIEELGLLYALKLAITAEELYQMTQLIKLKMNMSVTNMDEDRIGKIEELKAEIENFKRKNLIHKSLKDAVLEFNQKLDNRYTELKQQSILAKSDIDSLINNSKNSFDSFFEICDSSYQNLETMNSQILTGFKAENEILLDNRGTEPKLFIKKPVSAKGTA
ncbi:hypothetical protein SAMN04488033_11658 [Salegentibacter agarivorans]|uniref:Uncharacterized protein n=1 Tax=Salegentibacter agarivorans TaxID=345907 RepID=A0A1I2MWW9_9FLAO|nr:hypothetical protein [Salegentibacter agarivorans]SFF95608.1 hypothetical protein SAMN04488033_11658 [Salegentibacter agarivorans]